MYKTQRIAANNNPIGRDKRDHMEKIFIFFMANSVLMALALPYYPVKIFLAFTLGLFFIYLSFVRLDLALCFFVLFMPIFDLFPPDFFGVKGMNAQTLITAILVTGSLSRVNRQHNPQQLPDPLKLPIIVFVSLILISILRTSIFGSYPLLERLTLAKHWLIFIVLHFIVFKSANTHTQRRIFLFIISTITLVAALSLKDFFTVPDYLDRHRNMGGMIGNQPNLYGGFLAMYAPLFIAAFYMGLNKKWRKFLWLGLGACLLALFTTMSRGAWVACLAGITFLGLFIDRRLLLVLLAGGLLIAIRPPQALRERYEDTFLGEGEYGKFEKDQEFDNSTQLRILQWSGVPTMMTDNPFTGTGFETFGEVVYTKGVLPFPKAAHSTFIRIAVEQGVIGCLAFLWLLGTVFKHSWYGAKNASDPTQKAVSVGLLGCVTALIVVDISGCRFYDYELMAYFWIMSGMAMRNSAEIKTSRQRAFREDRKFA